MPASRHVRTSSIDSNKQGLLNSHDPQVFLPRMGNVVSIVVGDDCWFDRDELRKKLD